jgi:hypothetical protein
MMWEMEDSFYQGSFSIWFGENKVFFFRIFVWQQFEKQPLERLMEMKCCWGNIKMDLEEIGCGELDCLGLGWGSLMGFCGSGAESVGMVTEN